MKRERNFGTFGFLNGVINIFLRFYTRLLPDLIEEVGLFQEFDSALNN